MTSQLLASAGIRCSIRSDSIVMSRGMPNVVKVDMNFSSRALSLAVSVPTEAVLLSTWKPLEAREAFQKRSEPRVAKGLSSCPLPNNQSDFLDVVQMIAQPSRLQQRYQ